MSVLWQINGSPAAGIGVTTPQRNLVSLGIDTFVFEIAGRAADAAYLYAYGAPVVVTRNGGSFFRGQVIARRRLGSGSAEGHQYTIGGPWWALERLTYQQPWVTGEWVDGVWTPAEEPAWQSRVILGQQVGGGRNTTGGVVSEVIAYAAGCGVAIAPGQIDAGVEFPWDEVTDIACSEAILRVVRWTPGVSSWIDYSQPVPTFNLVAHGAGRAVSIPATECREIQEQPREDLAITAVVLHYDRMDVLDGYPSRVRVTDAYPAESTGKEVGALVSTIELAGTSVTKIVQRVVVEALPTDSFAANTDWWLARCEALRNPAITELVITGEGRSGTLPNELISGSLHDWMRASIEDPADPTKRITTHQHLHSLQDEEDVWTCKATYKVPDPARGNELIEKIDVITVRITATDAETRNYVKQDVRYGDRPVPDLAQTIYQTLQINQTAGGVVFQEEECSGVARPSDVVSLAGLPGVLSGGLVQRVAEDLDRGTTTVSVGPPGHLGVTDLITLLRINRTRRPSARNVERVTGIVQDNVELSSAIPKRVLTQMQVMGEWVSVVVAARYDTVTDQIQVKTREVRVVAMADESEWTLIPGGQAVDCPE